MPRLPPLPDLDWRNVGTPRAMSFDDVYFSREGGLAESVAVFLAGCYLPEAWADRDRFTLCELGFGSGLNVLAVWRAWKKTRLPHAQLHISTIEAFPLAREDAARALAQFPEVADLSKKLLAQWPVRAYGPQRLWFPEHGLSLTVHIGEAAAILEGLDGVFDAWFLDGFAPARNPAMWSPEVLGHVGRLSAAGARLATFTVAGEVRRNLEAAGFAVEKEPGFGAKRERLEALFTGAGVSTAATRPSRVAIIGAGIAGAACAQALLRRGVETIVLDAASDLGAGASGNPAGLVMPRLDRGGVLSGFYIASYLHAVAAYEALGVLDACGVVQRAEARNADALADLLVDPPLPNDWFSTLADASALHARAGIVRPRAAIEAMIDGAQVLREARVQSFERLEHGWLLRTADGRAMLKADAVIIACGATLSAFEPARFLPIALSRGQIEWGQGEAPRRALTQSAYVAPFDGGVLFGATFDPVEAETDVASDAASRARNLDALRALAPEIAASLRSETLHSRASLRATTPDRAPIAGQLPDAEAWLAPTSAQRFHDGVYVLGGLGARGLTHAPLLGEALAGDICGEASLLPRAQRAALAPDRFLKRALRA
jgi:tRNA 5-methylaminomethyl-2-thiouridine biosynthesis bifunctional protein